MPKVVDHDMQKRIIAEAACAIIAKEGMEQATVRSIARKAGMSLGAVRHYFPSQAELFAYAMNLVKERVHARLEAILDSGLPPREMVIRLLLELIPLDPDTSLEMEVWFAYIYHGKHAGGFPDGPQDDLRKGMGGLLRNLDKGGFLRPGLDLDLETETVYALVDGLALHVLVDPRRLGRDQVIRVLNRYLDSIFRPDV
jgi:AcrR family transcriptional regulator